MLKRTIIFIVLIAVVVLAWQLTRPPQETDSSAQIIAPEAEIPNLGFQTVSADYEFSLPADQQPHPEYQRERWTLDLTACYEASASVSFERIGFVASIFAAQRDSAWGMNSVMIVTISLPNFQTTHYSRMALELAGSESGRVWLENWSLTWNEDTYTLSIPDHLEAVFTTPTDPQTSIEDTYYSLQHNLQAEINDAACSPTLTHTFGENLP